MQQMPPAEFKPGMLHECWAARTPKLILMSFLSVCRERGSTVAAGSDHIIAHSAIWGMFTDIWQREWMFQSLVCW